MCVYVYIYTYTYIYIYIYASRYEGSWPKFPSQLPLRLVALRRVLQGTQRVQLWYHCGTTAEQRNWFHSRARTGPFGKRLSKECTRLSRASNSSYLGDKWPNCISTLVTMSGGRLQVQVWKGRPPQAPAPCAWAAARYSTELSKQQLPGSSENDSSTCPAAL